MNDDQVDHNVVSADNTNTVQPPIPNIQQPIVQQPQAQPQIQTQVQQSVDTSQDSSPLTAQNNTIDPNFTSPQSLPQNTANKKRPKKILLAAVLLLLLLIGGGAYGYFGVYLQSPQQLWNSAMKNTSEGLKLFTVTPVASSKSTKIKGTIGLTSPSVMDITVDGAVSGLTSQSKESISIAGVKANIETRTIKAATGNTPDVYIKVDGVKGLSDFFGPDLATTINGLSNKWYILDHNLVDQYISAFTDGADGPTPTAEELTKELTLVKTKVAEVVATYLFTTNDAKAMVIMKEAKGKEDYKGRSSQRVVAQLRKQQTHDMFIALKDAIKDTKLDEWLLAGTEQSFEEMINFEDLIKSVDNFNYDNATADVWIDTDMHYIRNVRLDLEDSKDKTKSSGTVDFTLDYKGGDDFPFLMSINSTEKDQEGKLDLGFTLKKGSNDFKITGAIDVNDNGDNSKGSMDMAITGSNDELKVEKPEGATDIMNLLGGFMNEIQQLQTNVTKTLGVKTFNDDTQQR